MSEKTSKATAARIEQLEAERLQLQHSLDWAGSEADTLARALRDVPHLIEAGCDTCDKGTFGVNLASFISEKIEEALQIAERRTKETE